MARKPSTKSCDDACSFIEKKDSRWLDYWEDYHRWCKMIFRLYMSKNEWTSMNKRARLALSLPFTIIETVAAETYAALFDEIPYFRQKPVGPEDEDAAEAVTQYIGHQTEKNKFRIKGYIFEKNRLMFGLSWAYVPWVYLQEYKRRMEPVMEPVLQADPMTGAPMPVINPMTGQPQQRPMVDAFGKPITKKVFKKETTFDCWDFEPLFPWHVRSDPSISDPIKLSVLSQGEGIIIDRYYSNSDLKKKQRDAIYYNVDDYLNAESDEPRGMSDVKEEDEEVSRDLNAGYSYKRNQNHIRQFWGKAPIVEVEKKSGKQVVWDDSAEPVEAVIDICDGHCFRMIRNPIDEQIRPIIPTQCHPIADNLISPGLMQAVESELRELSAFRNSRMDNLAQQMNPMYNVRASSNVSVRDLKYRPLGIVRTQNPESDILPFPVPNLGETLDRDMAALDYNIQNATNALSAAQGTSNMGQAFGRTATGIDFFQGRMQKRMKIITDVAEDQFFGQLSDIVNSYNQQFFTDEKEFSVIGKQNVYMTMKPDYLNRRDLIPVSASRKLNRGKMFQLFDRMITEAGTLKDFIKIDYLVKEMVKSTDAFANPDKLLYSAEERQKMAEGKPDEVKRGMNLSVAWKDLEPELKAILIKDIFPQSADELNKVTQMQMMPQMMPQMEQMDQPYEMQSNVVPLNGY